LAFYNIEVKNTKSNFTKKKPGITDKGGKEREKKNSTLLYPQLQKRETKTVKE